MKIAALQVDRLALQRDKAAIVFLFLSGMRIGAFCTLPINCVNIAARRIEQFPSRGVRTKNRKVATTTLLPIPALLSIVVILFAFYIGVPTRLAANVVLSSALCLGFAVIAPSLTEIDTFTLLQICLLFAVVNAIGIEMVRAANRTNGSAMSSTSSTSRP